MVGELFEQVGLHSVAGELLVGIILGPTVFKIITTDAQIQGLTSVALFFIIFQIGLELKTEDLGKHMRSGILLTLTSFIVPFAIALVLSLELLSFFGFLPDLIIALGLAVPSISIISVLVIEEGLLREHSGQLILSSTIITDVIALVLLSSLSSSFISAARIVIEVVLFLAAFVGIDYLLKRYRSSITQGLRHASGITRRADLSYAVLIVVGLVVASIFQGIGVSYIIGAFFAGLLVHREIVGKRSFNRLLETLSKMNRGFFIPIFFGFAGVEASLPTQNPERELLGLAVILVATIGVSLLLSYLAAKRLHEEDAKDAKHVAVILGGRGAVGIVVVTVALGRNLINSSGYSLVIFGTVIASILVPLLLREKDTQKRNENDDGREKEN